MELLTSLHSTNDAYRLEYCFSDRLLETEDPETWWEYGVLIDDSYVHRGTVCGVDADGRWYLLEQPDKVDELRFTP